MRVHSSRLQAVIDPERRRPMTAGASASPISSARSTGSAGASRPLQSGNLVDSARSAAGIGGMRHLTDRRGSDRPPPESRLGGGDRGDSARFLASPGFVPEAEDRTTFDLLHSEKGFSAFDAFFKRLLAGCVAPQAAFAPRQEYGWMLPQLFCPPTAVPEHAFLELMHLLADCTDSEASDLFDLLDYDFRGFLGLKQIYFAICMLAALDSKQSTKFLYYHASTLFAILARRCVSVAEERVCWSQLIVLFRVLGVPIHVVRACGRDAGFPDGELAFDGFLEVAFEVLLQLDRGGEESTVIQEKDRMDHVKSKLCVIL